MLIDLVHNKIIEDTITEKFAESVEYGLVSLLAAKYGDRMLGIQMYEDHLADGFMRDGEWYYPMTVITDNGAELSWVKWTVDASFDDGIPYTYMGEEQIAFTLVDAVPVEFLNKMKGRSIYYEGGYVRIKVQSTSQKPTFLAGKYSQSFVDEMARQITNAISSAMLIHGIEDSNIELHLVFAPATYMEHISDRSTYRRLLLAGKSGAPRDFWIKWTPTSCDRALTVSDHANGDSVKFELATDVPQKIKEKEYRFLLARSGDKYRASMGRKNVTEWREIIKRAVKRGEIIKLDPPVEENVEIPTVTQAPTLTAEPVTVPKAAEEIAPTTVIMPALDPDTLDAADEPIVAAGGIEEDDFERAMRIAREAVGASASDDTAPADDDGGLDEITKLAMAALAGAKGEAAEVSFGDEDEQIEDEDTEIDESEDGDDEIDPTEDEFDGEEEIDEDLYEDEDAAEEAALLEPVDAPTPEAPTDPKDYEEKIRAELEAKIRLEYESRARIRAEEEAARLRREQEQLRAENERLQELARREKELKAEREAARVSEEAKLRAQIEAQIRAEVKEKERLAEAARNAVLEQKRLEAERAERERKRIEEEARLEAERRRAEEAARLEAERAREAERIRREREEKAAREKANITPEATENYNYTRKCVKLIFRRNVDPNITGRIHEIIKATIDYYRKSDVYIRIKASVPEPTVVLLDFVQIPEEEMELLKNIIKVLGNSGLGIAKAIVE